MDPLEGPSCSRSLSPTANKKSRNFLKLFFRNSIAERNAQSYISREGSITQNAWNGMNKNSNWKIRLKTLENLEDVVKKRRLQVSTLEGVWVETCDMLEIDCLRRAFLSLMCSLTRAQCEELGLALRLTFFETIKEIGVEELTLQWLIALTDEGRNIEPFEYFIGEILIDWMKISFSDSNFGTHVSFSSVLGLIQLIERIFIHNSTFISEAQLKQIINCFCKKICNCQNFLIMPMLMCFEAALKYSHIPKSELLPMVVSLCLLVSNSSQRQNTWRLLRILLSSVNAYTILRILQAILTNFFHMHASDVPLKARVAVVRGAVFCVAMALWGSQRIDSLKVSSSIVVPALSEAMTLDATIAREVLMAVRRLVGKFGKSLQQLTWMCVIQLLERAVKYVKMNQIPESSDIFNELIQIIILIENLYLQNEYCGSLDAFFLLVESCASNLPDELIFRLIDYRVSCIDPLSGNWILQMLTLIQKYINSSNSLKHREKALCILSNVYHKYRLLYETDVVKNLSLVICAMIPDEKDSNFQYQLIMFLFDMAKSVSLRLNNELFGSIVRLIRDIINTNIAHFARNDNLEIMACCIGELLNERWSAFDADLIEAIISMIIEHLKIQYSLELCGVIGSDVRARFFEALLLIQMDPSTLQLARIIPNSSNPNQMVRLTNLHIVIGSHDLPSPPSSSTLSCTEFKWTEISKITINALRGEQSWPVIRKILECLSGVLEFRLLVYSAGEKFVSHLVSAIIEVYFRYERHYLILLENDEFSKYLCPVLGKLINYSQDVQLCRVLVECAKGGCIQAIMACDLAVQVLPEKMALLNRQLIDYLLKLRPSAQLAIPIIELVGDSADVDKFYEFFQEKQFKSIVDVLAPYSNAAKFNVFIISSVYFALMRWFVRVPERLRPEMTQYIIGALTAINHKENSITVTSTPQPSIFPSLTSRGVPPFLQKELSPKVHTTNNGIIATTKPIMTELSTQNEFASSTSTNVCDDIPNIDINENISTSICSTNSVAAFSSSSITGDSSMSSSSAATLAAHPQSDMICYGDFRSATVGEFIGSGQESTGFCGDTITAMSPVTAITDATFVATTEVTISSETMNVAPNFSSVGKRNSPLLTETSTACRVLPRFEKKYFPPTDAVRQHSGDGRQLSAEAPFSVVAPQPMFSIGPSSMANEIPHVATDSPQLDEMQGRKADTGEVGSTQPNINLIENDDGKSEKIDDRKHIVNDKEGKVDSFLTESVGAGETAEAICRSGCNDNVHKMENSLAELYDVSDEMLEMLRLFMRYWRKRDLAQTFQSTERRRRRLASHTKIAFLEEDCNDAATLHDGFEDEMNLPRGSICEKSVEHWAVENSVLTVRLLYRKDFATNRWHGYRNATFSGERPLSTGGIGLSIDKSTVSGDQPLKENQLATNNNLHGNINNNEKLNHSNYVASPIAIEASENCGDGSKEGTCMLARSNSSPPNPFGVMDSLVNFACSSKAEQLPLQDGVGNMIGVGTSKISARPLNSPITDNFELSNKFRRRNFSNTQGVRRHVPSYFSSIKANQVAVAGFLAGDVLMRDLSTGGGGVLTRINSPESTDSSTSNLEYVQIILRHSFGKQSWVMRSFDQIPVDFHTGMNNWPVSDASSLLLHLSGHGSANGVLRLAPKENDATQRSLRILDRMEAEELHVVGVLYIGEEQSQETEILANQYGSDRYMKFLKLFGEVVSLDDDPGGLQKGKHGKFTYEYSDAISRIVFLVATLMPNSQDDPRCNAKKSLIGNNFVSIVFNESGKPYRLGTVSGQFDKVTLEVVPHDDDTVVVSLHARREVACWMAMTRAFLADEDAVRMLRKMAVRAQLSVNVWRSLEECRRNATLRPYLSQAVDRLRKIRSLRLKGVPEL